MISVNVLNSNLKQEEIPSFQKNSKCSLLIFDDQT